MMRLSSGEAFQVFIDDFEMPIQPNNLGMLNIAEDFGTMFCYGKLEFADPMGIHFSFDRLNLKGGEKVTIKLIRNGDTYQYDFVLTEFPAVVKDTQSGSNMYSIMFASPGIEGMVSPKYSRGFGSVASSSVVKEIVKNLNFESYSIDVSRSKYDWVQGYQSNRDFIKFLVSKSISVYANMADFTVFTDMNNGFHFESMYKLFDNPARFQFSNIPKDSENIRVSSISFGNMREVYEPEGGAGVTTWYWDESAQKMRKYEVGLDNAKVHDGARNLGRHAEEVTRKNLVVDGGWMLGRDEISMRVNAEFPFINMASMGQFIYVSPEVFLPDLHVGDTVLLNYYLSNGDINTGMSGKYLIIGNALIIKKSAPQTSLKLMRLGYNDGIGRTL